MLITNLKIIVNGHQADITTSPSDSLDSVKTFALKRTGNTIQPVEDWEFRDEQGNILDASKEIGEHSSPVMIWLSLKAGVAA